MLVLVEQVEAEMVEMKIQTQLQPLEQIILEVEVEDVVIIVLLQHLLLMEVQV
jgi:hypothetical protein